MSRLLFGHSPSAPRKATLWLLANAAAGLLVGVLLNSFSGAGRGVIAVAIWGAYLGQSRRVANTYRAEDVTADSQKPIRM